MHLKTRGDILSECIIKDMHCGLPRANKTIDRRKTNGQEKRDGEFSDILHHTTAGSGNKSLQDKECPELTGERGDSLQMGIKILQCLARVKDCCLFYIYQSQI